MPAIVQDLRYGFRMLRNNPGFTIGAVLSLSLAIGANTAIFNLIDSILLKPLPVKEPSRLVALYTFDKKNASYRSTSYSDYIDYRDQNRVFSGLAAYARIPVNLNNHDFTERISGEIVTSNYFSVLGIEATAGRTFLPHEESLPGGSPVALIGYDLWQRRFSGDPQLVGQTITLNRYPFTVIGIMPRQFKGTVLDWTEPPEIWVPMEMSAQILPIVDRLLDQRQSRFLRVIGRLNSDITINQAQAAAQILSTDLARTYPAEDEGSTAVLLPANSANFWPTYRDSITRSLILFAAVVGLVLILACTNIANLLLERASARRQEIAIRLSLGATRSRLVRQLLTENVLLSLLSIVFALLISYGMGKTLLTFPRALGIPLALDLTPDARSFVFTVVVSVLTTVAFGLIPALQTTTPDLATTLKDTGTALSPGNRQSLMRKTLLVIQVVVASVLLMGGGLFVRSLLHAYAIDPGFRGENLQLLSLDLATQGYTESQGKTFYQNLTERMRSIPGVQSAGLSNLAPLSPVHKPTNISSEGRYDETTRQPFSADHNLIGPQYFQTIGIPLLGGRDFNERDTEATPAVTIINQTLAARLWPRSDPLGQRLMMLTGQDSSVPLVVVGVVKDAKYQTVWEQPRPYFYLPISQNFTPAVTLVVRTAGVPGGIVTRLRSELRAMDPNLPVFEVKTWAEQMQLSLSRQRLGAALLGVFGLLALLLASVGIYSVVAYSIAQRTREIGIRMALGAAPGNILWQVMRQGMPPVLIGVTTGLVLTIVLAKSLAESLTSQIPDAAPIDLPIYLLVSLLLTIVGLVATYIPARRASRVDPLLAMRHE